MHLFLQRQFLSRDEVWRFEWKSLQNDDVTIRYSIEVWVTGRVLKVQVTLVAPLLPRFFVQIKHKICLLSNSVNTTIRMYSFGGWRGIMKCSLFHYSSPENLIIPLFPKNQVHYSIIPLQKFPLFLCHYSSSPPDTHHTFRFHWSVWQDFKGFFGLIVKSTFGSERVKMFIYIDFDFTAFIDSHYATCSSLSKSKKDIRRHQTQEMCLLMTGFSILHPVVFLENIFCCAMFLRYYANFHSVNITFSLSKTNLAKPRKCLNPELSN